LGCVVLNMLYFELTKGLPRGINLPTPTSRQTHLTTPKALLLIKEREREREREREENGGMTLLHVPPPEGEGGKGGERREKREERI
jgi:hypothetical protein